MNILKKKKKLHFPKETLTLIKNVLQKMYFQKVFD